MPELPEVEVTRRRIAPLLVDRRIERVRTTGRSYFWLTDPARVRRRLAGRRVVELSRLGKYLTGELDDGQRLIMHLGMTGQLFSAEASSVRLLGAAQRSTLTPEQQRRFEPDAHTHLRLVFSDDGPDVLFRDVRKFGKVKLLRPGEREPRIDRLGPDALQATAEHLFRASRKRKVAAKALLLDQSVLAGVGNIYADEALFLSGVRPGRRAGRLTRAECQRIVAALHRILERSIETGGSSISDYIAPDGSDGGYQDERRVYARTGEPCSTCGEPILRTVIGARGTHYCRVCQR